MTSGRDGSPMAWRGATAQGAGSRRPGGRGGRSTTGISRPDMKTELGVRGVAGRRLAGLLLVAVFALTGMGRAMAQDFRSDFTVDITRYVGLWYETARTPNEFQDNTPSRDGDRLSACFNTTTEYAVEDGRTIRLLNTCRRRAPDGAVVTETARGVALVQQGSQGRRLKLAFGPGVGRLFQRLFADGGFDYWIYCLGPVNEADVYDWAVVSGPDRDFIFVLTRGRLIADPLRTEILACARTEGLPVDALIYRQE